MSVGKTYEQIKPPPPPPQHHDTMTRHPPKKETPNGYAIIKQHQKKHPHPDTMARRLIHNNAAGMETPPYK